MKHILRLSLVLFILTSCTATRNATKDDGKIEVNLIQINDVYEIAPLTGGREGGMARVATLKKQYQQKNPNSFLAVAGDCRQGTSVSDAGSKPKEQSNE